MKQEIKKIKKEIYIKDKIKQWWPWYSKNEFEQRMSNGNLIEEEKWYPAISPYKLFAPISRLAYPSEIPQFVLNKAKENGKKFAKGIIDGWNSRDKNGSPNFAYALKPYWVIKEKWYCKECDKEIKLNEKKICVKHNIKLTILNEKTLTPLGKKIQKTLNFMKYKCKYYGDILFDYETINETFNKDVDNEFIVSREYNGYLFAARIDLMFKNNTIELKQSSQTKNNKWVKILQDGQLWIQSYCSGKKSYLLWCGDEKIEFYNFNTKKYVKERNYDMEELIELLLLINDNKERFSISEQDIMIKNFFNKNKQIQEKLEVELD